MSTLLGKGLGRLVAGLVKTLLGIVPGLLKGLTAPVTAAVQRRRRKSRRRRDVKSVKSSFGALRKGKGPRKAMKPLRRRAKKRFF
jgi:hypothetical protein